MSTHTPEPWFHRHPMGGSEIYPDGNTHAPLATFEREADCDRAILCVNACAGMSDEEVLEMERKRAGKA